MMGSSEEEALSSQLSALSQKELLEINKPVIQWKTPARGCTLTDVLISWLVTDSLNLPTALFLWLIADS
jgi:hypothetical protein